MTGGVKMRSMMPVTVCLLLGVIPGAGRADIRSQSCQLHYGSTGSLRLTTESTEAESPIITLGENEQIVFAELSFEDDLEPGTEVEIWPEIAGETPPWELADGVLPVVRNSWITDGRTGNLVRFDVTDIVHSWQSGSLPDSGFVVRIVADEEESQSSTSIQSATSLLAGARNVSFLIHVQPVMPLKDDEDAGRPEPAPAKLPKREDAGGRN